MLGDNSRSLRIFTWLGIPVYLHWSFFLIFLYALYIGWSEQMTPAAIVWLMLFFVAMFGCVLLHEYGHSLAARRYGVVTHDIILTPLGGMARLARIPEKPIQEFIVAIAGPLVNVVIALVLYAFGKFYFSGDAQSLFSEITSPAYLVSFIKSILSNESQPMPDLELGMVFMAIYTLLLQNILLFIFNLLPAFPMDGGRILRSIFSSFFGRVKGTKFALWVGNIAAALFILLGILNSNYILALIGVFVITTARAEYRQVRNSAMLRNHTAASLVRYQFTRIYLNDWVQSAQDLLSHVHERAFLVYDLQNTPVGVLSEADIYKAKKANSLATPVSQWMQNQIPAVSLHTGVEQVQAYLNHEGVDLLAVQDPTTGAIVGVIDDLGLELFIERQEREVGG